MIYLCPVHDLVSPLRHGTLTIPLHLTHFIHNYSYSAQWLKINVTHLSESDLINICIINVNCYHHQLHYFSRSHPYCWSYHHHYYHHHSSLHPTHLPTLPTFPSEVAALRELRYSPSPSGVRYLRLSWSLLPRGRTQNTESWPSSRQLKVYRRCSSLVAAPTPSGHYETLTSNTSTTNTRHSNL